MTADFDDARVGQGLGDQRVGHLGRGRARGEVHGLHQGLAPLALVGLREAGHGPAERSGRTLRRLAVQAAHAGRRDEERAGGGHGVVQHAHGRVEVLDAPAIRLAEGGEVHVGDGRLHVERGQPEDALDGTFLQPTTEAAGDCVGGQRAVE